MTGWLRCLGGAWLLALLLLATPATVYAQATPAAPQDGVVVQLSFVDQADLQRLAVRYDVWRVDHAARAVTVWLTPAELRQVQAQSRRVVVDQAATDDFYAAQATVNAAQSSSGIPGFTCYRTVEETHATMAQLVADHPTLVRPVILGKSWAATSSGGSAGYPISGIVLSNQTITETKPVFFLIAAIHAREYTTAESALRFAEQLVHGYGVDPDATWLLDYTEIHIVPQTNPDGRKRAEAKLDWRKNVNSDFCAYDPYRYGVDLNRNSSFKWAQCAGFSCSSSDPRATSFIVGPLPHPSQRCRRSRATCARSFPTRAARWTQMRRPPTRQG